MENTFSPHKLKTPKFIQHLQKTIFGQEIALRRMANILQAEYLQLREKSGPLCQWLWMGPAETGKTTAAMALAEYLFDNTQALLRIVVDKNVRALEEVRVIVDNKQCRLLDMIEAMPHAVLLIDDLQADVIDWLTTLFQPIWQNGIAFDTRGKPYSFQQAMLIITTTLGSENLRALIPATTAHDTTQPLDLMQLVLNEPALNAPQTTLSATHDHSETVWNGLKKYFPQHFLQACHLVPFMPLDPTAIEKLLRVQFTALGKRLQTLYDIELSYAPEVIRFLTHEIVWRKPHKTIENMLTQHVYECISHEIVARIDDKTKPKQLMLQLSAQGQLIRCEWGITSPVY